MSGVSVIRTLLAADSPLIAAVHAARIKAGTLPLNTALPAITVTSISSVRRNTVSMAESTTLVTERVQVSLIVHDSAQGGTDYPGLTTAMKLIRQACPNQNGTIAGISVDSILPDSEGPDIDGPVPESLQRSQDFRVTWLENR